MGKLIGVCGLDCSACNAFIAGRTGDSGLKRKTAEEWSRLYGARITPEMIDCHGCLADDGVQFGHCRDCAMRNCATGKGLANCGECGSYPCPEIDTVLPAMPSLRAEQATAG